MGSFFVRWFIEKKENTLGVDPPEADRPVSLRGCDGSKASKDSKISEVSKASKDRDLKIENLSFACLPAGRVPSAKTSRAEFGTLETKDCCRLV